MSDSSFPCLMITARHVTISNYDDCWQADRNGLKEVMQKAVLEIQKSNRLGYSRQSGMTSCQLVEQQDFTRFPICLLGRVIRHKPRAYESGLYLFKDFDVPKLIWVPYSRLERLALRLGGSRLYYTV